MQIVLIFVPLRNTFYIVSYVNIKVFEYVLPLSVKFYVTIIACIKECQREPYHSYKSIDVVPRVTADGVYYSLFLTFNCIFVVLDQLGQPDISVHVINEESQDPEPKQFGSLFWHKSVAIRFDYSALL